MTSSLRKSTSTQGYTYSQSRLKPQTRSYTYSAGYNKYTPNKHRFIPRRDYSRSFKEGIGNQKSVGVALILWFFGGVWCLHNFYLQRKSKGKKIIIWNLMCCLGSFVAGYTFYSPTVSSSFSVLSFLLMGFFFLTSIGLFFNWVSNFFSILNGKIENDRGERIF